MLLVKRRSPVITGESASPRCFKNLKDKTRPYRAYYFKNKKAWIDSELMQSILRRLNKRFVAEKGNIVLFMDNASCHPADFEGMFSYIKVSFLPKNITSCLQPHDAGIIRKL